MDNILTNHKFKTYRKLKPVDEVIGFTWSPDETKFTCTDIYYLIDALCHNSAYYSFFSEFRDKVLCTGLHYHGILHIFDRTKFWYKYAVPKWNGIGKIGPHWEFNLTYRWDIYIQKQNGILYTNYPDSNTIRAPAGQA